MPRQVLRRGLLFITAAVLTLAFASAASAATYVVLYKAKAVPADGGAEVRAAGGSVVASYPQIGVIVAESDAADFAAKLGSDTRIDTVASSNQPVAKVGPVEAESHDGDGG